MLAQNKVKAFIPTTDLKSARPFYETILGFKFLEEDPYGQEFEMDHSILRVVLLPDHQPQKFTVLGWKVPDINGSIASLRSQGVLFEKYDFMQQDENDVWTAPNGTKVAWFKDPSGNILSIDTI